jgi:anhydro-N-acetylmuramic acid kinase
VIADFRSRDIAAGGQGAPLVPAFHQALFAKAGVCRAVVNIGGMSNISVLYGKEHVQGCDTGPGNVLLDAWIEARRGLPFDAEGAWAASGQVCPALLASLQSEPFFALPPPKSTGRDLFHMSWLQQHLAHYLAQYPALSEVDIQATLTALTAQTIADMLLRCSNAVETLYVCGGGANNTYLMALLAKALPNIRLTTTADLGVVPEHVEAMAFAWLARCHLLRQPGNLPVVTGAAGGRILGACYPA